MTIYAEAMTLFFVMDSLGNIPIFLSILKNYSPNAQTRIIFRECCIAFVVLLMFLFFGDYLMKGLGLTTPALSVAGATVLFLISLKMIFPGDKSSQPEEQEEEPLVVPLAIPLTAGPSAMATILLFKANPSRGTLSLFIAILIASVASTLILLSSRYLMRLLGNRGLVAVERLMGMILTVIAVQMFLSGIAAYLK